MDSLSVVRDPSAWLRALTSHVTCSFFFFVGGALRLLFGIMRPTPDQELHTAHVVHDRLLIVSEYAWEFIDETGTASNQPPLAASEIELHEQHFAIDLPKTRGAPNLIQMSLKSRDHFIPNVNY